MSLNKIEKALKLIRDAKELLKEVKVIHHEKTIHCEIAEWLVAEYVGGTRAIKGNQKGWDIELNDGKKIQVKSHAIAKTNNSPWTTLSKDSIGVNELFVVLFTPDYFIEEIFRISIDETLKLRNKGNQVAWGKLRKKNKAIDKTELRKKYPFLFE